MINFEYKAPESEIDFMDDVSAVESFKIAVKDYATLDQMCESFEMFLRAMTFSVELGSVKVIEPDEMIISKCDYEDLQELIEVYSERLEQEL